LLTPDDWREKSHNVRTEDMERPGIGAALCGLVGGALGVAAGLELGTLAAAVPIAGGDPAFTLALLCAVILGVGGAAAGVAAGQALETSLCDGLPKDDLQRCQSALRQGRSVLIAFTDKAPSAVAVRDVMARAGAESLDAAGKWWWFGRRPGRLRQALVGPAFDSLRDEISIPPVVCPRIELSSQDRRTVPDAARADST
jgi:hypothetical protein